ncbi:MAG TPA: gas vesicle protein GvpG [Nitrolancea sp.]|nr:gas vesicle protein GvpG [Nitrolancea sp.]
MGLITGLLLFPVSGPIHGMKFVLEQIRDQAEAELYDEGRIRAELLNLNLLRETGEISAEEAAEMEDALIERLNLIRAEQEGWLELPEIGEVEPDEPPAEGADA